QLIFAQYGAETYTRGLSVYTTIDSREQEVAYKALRRGLMDYERRQRYRGPEANIELPADAQAQEQAIDDALADRPDTDDIVPAVVTEASPKKVVAVRQNGEAVTITGEGLRLVASALSDKAHPNIRIKPGSIVRLEPTTRGTYEIVQLPDAEGAFVAMDPRDGGIKALVGGFDFNRNKFNHVTQAWRQPGSSFKPFIYSAAIERGFTPTTIVNDAPLFFTAEQTGGEPWEPKNFEGTYDGPIPLRRALAKSKNMVTIRVLQSIGPRVAQEWSGRFGFDVNRQPPFLALALGSGTVTPLQMATAYSVFANGGYRLNPYLVTRVADSRGTVLADFSPQRAGTPGLRVIDARNAFLMTQLLQEVTRSGTAARAQAVLKRPDIYGKTGTTNESVDAWFAGYQQTMVAIAWIGYDTPKSLGDRETGGGLALPIWITFMQTALKGVPVSEPTPPEGIVNIGGEYYYSEYTPDTGIKALDVETPAPPDKPPPNVTEEDKRSILDIFKDKPN
ncbi:MAG: penicillin-binding protein, partial [Betaproteobacteria bacterium]|nr:penicillin-binding protein [Betaproteobacteria bacterium]